MFQIGKTIISVNLLEQKFVCDLHACNGCCCRYGDSGAPLSPEEAMTLEQIWPTVRRFLRPEGITAIEEQGTSVTDFEGECVTPLIGNQECAYTLNENGIWLCGIERAWLNREVEFRKPLSCHLFPVRIKYFTDFIAVNYEEWPICEPAVACGKEKDVKLYRFLKDPLIRAFGEEWYEQLLFVAGEYEKDKNKFSDL